MDVRRQLRNLCRNCANQSIVVQVPAKKHANSVVRQQSKTNNKQRTHKLVSAVNIPIDDEIVPVNCWLVMFLWPMQQHQLDHVSLANQHGTYKSMTLPPLHVAGRAQFAVEANRGHAVVLHPVKKKSKKKNSFHTGLWCERNEPRPI
jgi:hypothetical protein